MFSRQEMGRQRILSIGEQLPTFKKKGLIRTEQGFDFVELTDTHASAQGKWIVNLTATLYE